MRALIFIATGNMTDSEKVAPNPTTTAVMCRKIENSTLVTASGIETPLMDSTVCSAREHIRRPERVRVARSQA